MSMRPILLRDLLYEANIVASPEDKSAVTTHSIGEIKDRLMKIFSDRDEHYEKSKKEFEADYVRQRGSKPAFPSRREELKDYAKHVTSPALRGAHDYFTHEFEALNKWLKPKHVEFLCNGVLSGSDLKIRGTDKIAKFFPDSPNKDIKVACGYLLMALYATPEKKEQIVNAIVLSIQNEALLRHQHNNTTG